MPELAAYDDGGALAAALRRAVPALPGARPARALAGLALLAAGVAIGPGALVVAVVALVLLAVPGERRRSALWWLVPALLRAAEYGMVVAVAARAGHDAPHAAHALPAAYALLAALSFHHYDLVYRMRYARLAPPRWLSVAGGGFEVRMLVIALVALGGGPALAPVLAALAGALAALFVVESVGAWWRWLAAGGSALG
ncbi:MAG: DUF5941 domain-containing protein [Frankiaceae bacterium]